MRWLLAGAAAALLVAGCGGGSASSSSTPPSTSSAPETTSLTTTSTAASSTASAVTLARGFRLYSSAFRNGGKIPARYTCDGLDVSIPLAWSGVPANARELVLIMRDPDAPSGNFVHWAVAGITPTARLPFGIEGRNSFGTLGYRGPCPPRGKTHHYVITLNALGGPSNLKTGFTADQLRTAAVGIATLIGTYSRP